MMKQQLLAAAKRELDLDKQLRLRSMPLDLKTAEEMKVGGRRYIKARVFVTVTGVTSAADPKLLVLTAHVRKHGSGGG